MDGFNFIVNRYSHLKLNNKAGESVRSKVTWQGLVSVQQENIL